MLGARGYGDNEMLTPPTALAYPSPESLTGKGVVCVKGSIHYREDRNIYYVAWYHAPHKKTYKLYKYRGIPCETRNLAEKLLASMQGDFENGFFRIEKYTRETPADVIPYLWEWLNAVNETLKPGMYKDYANSIKNHLEPFFLKHSVQLHEIQLDVLLKLMNSIEREGKGKMNVLYCLHACLDFAWRSNRIQTVLPFPKRKQYHVQRKPVQWLPEERQIEVINAIPQVHQPIFWWLKYHYRRLGEACALRKEDFDGETFTIRRTESARVFTDSTKTGDIHLIPMVEEFRPILEAMQQAQKKQPIISLYLFVNPDGKKPGKPYHVKTLGDLWTRACQQVGEHIRCYVGTKHSSCSQFINEKGGTESELQMITDHARLESVRDYARTEVARRKELMERKTVALVRRVGEASK